MNRLTRPLLVALTTGGVFCLAGCGSQTPTVPASAKASFIVAFAPFGGTYSAQFAGKTFTAAGAFEFSMAPGTYEITGTFRATAFGIGFGAVAGGVQSGSLRSLSGPSPETKACQITYLASNNALQSFRVQLQVTANPNSACQGF